MSDVTNQQRKDRVDELKAGYELVLSYSKTIALFPIDKWLEEINHAECFGHILDPTLYREYIWSDKPKILKEILEAALVLKRTVEKLQPRILDIMDKEKRA
jgi:hypothetical protein